MKDMEAFKAANPGSCMGDFVRWYSPTDWIDSQEAEAREKDTISNLGAEEKKNEEESELDSSKYSSIGRLSLRMRAPGNIWCKFWNESLPTPVYDQKPLFNFTKEAEKALHYLETISPSDLINQFVVFSFLSSTPFPPFSLPPHPFLLSSFPSFFPPPSISLLPFPPPFLLTPSPFPPF